MDSQNICAPQTNEWIDIVPGPNGWLWSLNWLIHLLINSVTINLVPTMWGLPWGLRCQRICLQCRRPGFNPSVGKMPWRRAWQPTPILAWRIPMDIGSLASYSPEGHRVGRNWSDLACRHARTICACYMHYMHTGICTLDLSIHLLSWGLTC